MLPSIININGIRTALKYSFIESLARYVFINPINRNVYTGIKKSSEEITAIIAVNENIIL